MLFDHIQYFRLWKISVNPALFYRKNHWVNKSNIHLGHCPDAFLGNYSSLLQT